ncbi:biotin transporter BioY [Priestia megaterium]|uniref:biotin transporter BioY n=1 Tax=Priestia megaterium TaxID=1404 RepID=UPI0036DF46B7
MKPKTMAYVSLFAALTAIGAFIKIPIPYIPFTLQIVPVYLAGALLGPRLGLYSQLCYIGIGLIGVPVFAEGGGLGYIFKPTFGYLIGYAAGSFMNGYLIQKYDLKKPFSIFLANLSTLAIVYAVGCFWLYGAMKWIIEKPLSLSDTLLFGAVLPMPGDLLLCILCSVLIHRMQPQFSCLSSKRVKAG